MDNTNNLEKWIFIGKIDNRSYYSCPKCSLVSEVFESTHYCQHCGNELKNPLVDKITKK